jgi:hypothetical protein
MIVASLKENLKSLGFPTNGKKAELINRLEEAQKLLSEDAHFISQLRNIYMRMQQLELMRMQQLELMRMQQLELMRIKQLSDGSNKLKLKREFKLICSLCKQGRRDMEKLGFKGKIKYGKDMKQEIL